MAVTITLRGDMHLGKQSYGYAFWNGFDLRRFSSLLTINYLTSELKIAYIIAMTVTAGRARW